MTTAVFASGASRGSRTWTVRKSVQTKYPILHDTTSVIADPLVRNMATVGGNLAHGDPANDHPATMLTLGAEVVAVGSGGERVIPVSDFFEGPLDTALQHGEILTEIRVPAQPGRQRRRIREAGAERLATTPLPA